MKTKVGLMLAGGGAKGAYQLGVIKALEERGLTANIKAVSGTSIGSINTLLFMVKQKYSYMYKMWRFMDKSYVFNQTRDDRNGIYDISSLVSDVSQKVNVNDVKRSKIKGYATTCKLLKRTNLLAQLNNKNMELAVFNLNSAKDPFLPVLASSSIPVVFGYAVIDDEYYVDGGMLDNYPVRPLLNDKCNIILSVPLDPRFDSDQYKNEDILHIDFGTKSIFYKNFLIDLTDTIKFNKEYEDDLIKLGYNATRRIIKKCVISGLLVRNSLGRWTWNKPKGYTYVSLTEKEETEIAQLHKNIIDNRKSIANAKKELRHARKMAKKRFKNSKKENEVEV